MSSVTSKLRWCIAAIVVLAAAFLILQPATFAQKEDKPEAKVQMVWEEVSSTLNMDVLRTRVPGGWFVSIGPERDRNRDSEPVRSTFYYYDPEHVWDGTSQPR
jgi:hypothetical protein